MVGPSPRVLDLFAVPDDVQPVPGDPGSGQVVAGDLVLSPDHEPALTTWLAPRLARLAVQRDELPQRAERDLRVAVPVPARDGAWVVEGWAANRWEPGTVSCADVDVVRSVGRYLHALLARWWHDQPEVLAERTDPVTCAESRLLDGLAPDPGSVTTRQVVHTRLWGHVLLDARGAPLVTHLRPTWQPPAWADALCAADAVASGADPVVLQDDVRGVSRGRSQDLLDAALRLRSEVEGRGARYDELLARQRRIRV